MANATWQALQQQPILQSVLDAKAAAAAAAAAAQAASADASTVPAMTAAADVGDVVPAVPMPQRLQPAKQAVCAAFHEQVNILLGIYNHHSWC